MPNEYLEATRNFDQMERGEKAWGDPADEYWANQIKAGNIIVVEATADGVVTDYFAGNIVMADLPSPLRAELDPEYEDLIPAEIPEDFEEGD